MKKRSVQRAYENIRPDEEAKSRILQNILNSSEIPPAEKDDTMKRRKGFRFIIVAAIIATLACTVVTAADMLRVPVQDNSVYLSDNKVELLFDIDDEVSAEYMPMLEVKPHQITNEEAKRVAHVLFGDAAFYEKVANLKQYYTKAEIEQKLDRWSQYTTQESLGELYGKWMSDSDVLELVNTFIERYQEKYKSAPEEIPYTPCEWTFKNGIAYYDDSSANPENFSDQIWAQLYVGDIPYDFCATNRDKEDFKVNSMYAVVATGISPNGIDEEIFKARLFRTQMPTQQQLDAVRAKAEAMLLQMDMGNWMIDQCYVDEKMISEEITEYRIIVTAVPVLHGVPVVRVPQFSALRDAENPIVKNYYYADVEFQFSPNGDLWLFDMQSPVEIVENLSIGETMSAQQLLDIAKGYLAECTPEDFSFIPSVYSGDDILCCRVYVNDLDYNLTRINKPGYTDRFYYVPGITVNGVVEYYEQNSGKVLWSEESTLLNLDGRDGSIISGVVS